MAVRNTMTNLIDRVRTLINDPRGASQIFDDQTIQNVLDDSRLDYMNEPLLAKPTFVSGTIQYLDYWHDLGSWEDGVILKQFLTVTVTPSASELIAGHWEFTATTLPPVYLTGSTHDIYRASADLLERWAAKYMTRFDFASDGQSFKLSQVPAQMQALACTYRKKQRVTSMGFTRSDLQSGGAVHRGLGATAIDYMASGNG
jgi:hypothetical protein